MIGFDEVKDVSKWSNRQIAIVFLLGFGFLSYFVTKHLVERIESEANEAKKDLKECNDGRLKDRDTYNSFLQNLKTNNELKKDSI